MVEALGLWGRRVGRLNQAQARRHLGGVLGGAQPSVCQLGGVLGGVQPSVHQLSQVLGGVQPPVHQVGDVIRGVQPPVHQLSEVLGHGEGLLGITESLDRPVGEGGHDLAAAGVPATAQPRHCRY